MAADARQERPAAHRGGVSRTSLLTLLPREVEGIDRWNVGESPPTSHRKGAGHSALGRSHAGAAPAVPGAEGGIRTVIQRCGSHPVGPLFNVRDGSVGKVIAVNPTTALYTPKTAKRSESQSMSAQQVELALGAVNFREKVILRLAVFAGMRPGELLAIQREHVKPDASVIEIRRRVYRGKFATPKNGLVRTIAIPPSTASLLRDWMEKAVDQNPEVYVFAGETGQPL